MMVFSISNVLFVLMLSRKSFEFTFNSNDGVTISYSVSFKQSCRNEQDKVGTIQGISLPECAKQCSLRAYCKALNFHRKSNLCYLFTSVTNGGQLYRGDCVEIKGSDIHHVTEYPCQNCEYNEGCDSSEKRCKHKECIDDFTLANGKVFGNLNGFDNRIMFECNFGYQEVNGVKDAVCLPSGNWSVTAVECQRKSVVNVALNKPTTMSSMYHNYDGDRGVDGNTNQNFDYGTCFHTNNDDNSWWRVDLQDTFGIFSVKLYNRIDICCGNLASDIELTIGLSLDSMGTAGTVQGQIDDIQIFNFPTAMKAKFVQVTRVGGDQNPLHLCEVEVMGFPTS